MLFGLLGLVRLSPKGHISLPEVRFEGKILVLRTGGLEGCVYSCTARGGSRVKVVNTSDRGWHREVLKCMNAREEFRLITQDQKLAQALELGRFRVRDSAQFVLADVPFIAGAGIAAAASSVLRPRQQPEHAASGDGSPPFFSFAEDSDRLRRMGLLAATGIAIAAGAFFLYRTIELLVSSDYQFVVIQQIGDCRWEIHAKPSA